MYPTPSPGAHTLLIVEDSPLQAELLRRALEEARYQVIRAAHGGESLELARRHRPALVISDINMPVMDGFALCAALRQDETLATTPVILVTSLSDPMDVLHGLKAGADAYLTKPYNIPALLDWVSTLLTRQAQQAPVIERRTTELLIGGERHPIRASAQRMINLLLSTYGNAVQQNRELVSTQLALEDLNASLATRVQEQTEAIRSSERRFRALIEHASDLVMVIDAAGHLLFTGPALTAWFGHDPEAVRGRILLDLVHPDDQARFRSALDTLQAEPARSIEFELRLAHRDGHWVWLEALVTNAMAEPSIGGLILNLRDISNRRRAEESIRKLSMAVEQSPESVLISDTEGRIEYVNAAFVANAGYSRQEAVGQRLCFQVERPDAGSEPAMWQALRAGQAWSGELASQRKDGSRYIESAVLTPIRDDAGQITHFLAVKQDVTERKRMEAELAQHRHHLERLVESRTAELAEARERAESANQAKSAFLANMSHEIRTPMNAITGLVHLLRRNAPRPDQEERLGKIAGAAEHLLSVINDILDLSKIEAGKLQLEHVDFEPERIVENVCNIIHDKAAAKGIELVLDLRGMPASLHGDGLRLGQILLNFVSNAVKFTENGSISLRAWVLGASDRGVDVRFEVADTGIGLTEEQRARLFRPFEQADVSTTRKFGGTGLGLAISRRMVELMEGRIGVDSTPGKGSTFWIEVPLGFGSTVLPKRVEQADTRGLRALVVDDLAESRESIADILGLLGLQVEQAPDGPRALARVTEADHEGRPFDILLAEDSLPAMSGLELGQRLAALRLSRQPRRLLLTGYGDPPPPESLTRAGYFEILQKPLTASRLFPALQALLTGQREQARQPEVHGAETLLRSRAGARVLLAEDNPINQEVALALLESVGLHGELAENGEIAVQKAREAAFDLILMDMQMPVMDGLNATRAIRGLPGYAETPILAMTANAFDEARESCMAVGMNDHISKPVDPEALYTTLLRWLPPLNYSGATRINAETGSDGAGQAGTSDQDQTALCQALAAVPGLDVEAGVRTANGNRGLYLRLLKKLLDNRDPAGLRKALASADWAQARHVAHTLKGVAATLGMKPLSEQAAGIERKLIDANGAPTPEGAADLEARAAQLEADFGALCGALRQVLPDPRAAALAEARPALDAAGQASAQAAARTALVQLQGLLAADDFAAVDFMHDHADVLEGGLGEGLVPIREQVECYAFAEALAAVEAALLQIRQ